MKTGRVDEAHLEFGWRSYQVETKRGARRKVLEKDGIVVAVKFVEEAEDDYVGLEVARHRSVQGGLVVFDGAWTKEGGG